MNKITLREEFIMLSILNLHEEAYLIKITDFLSPLTQKKESKTSVHGSLCRLEEKGFVKARFGGILHKRGGRRKKIYSLSKKGENTLKDYRRLRQTLWEKGC